MKRLATLIPVAMVVLAIAPVVRAGFVVDYDNPGDLAANFNLNHNGAGNKYVETAGVGLGGTQGVTILGAVDQAHTSAVYRLSSFDFSGTGDLVTVEHFFLRQDAPFPIVNFSVPQIGILTDNTEHFGSNVAGQSYASLRLLSSTANDTDVFLQSEVKSGSGTRQQAGGPDSATLTAGNWYRMVASFENVSATDVRITGALEDWGTTGASLVSTVLQITNADAASLMSFTGTDVVLGDSSVWPGWRAFAEGGVAVMDDFAAAPEPSTLALLAVAGGLIRRRRRSS